MPLDFISSLLFSFSLSLSVFLSVSSDSISAQDHNQEQTKNILDIDHLTRL